MEWIEAINDALRYIEAHLTEELCADRLAEVVNYSNFYLQRTFSIMTGMPLAEYVRQRRLSMAGQELQALDARVLDVALKYGYETPESFQKAFRRFHGISPSMAKRTAIRLRYLNPLQIHVTLTGGKMMDYCIEESKGFTLMGKVRQFKYDSAFDEIPVYWDEYFKQGLNKQVPGCLGICFDDGKGSEFPYMIGSFCEKDAPVPEGFEKREIGAHTWAKFRAYGSIPTALQKLNRQIYQEWLPSNNEYEPAAGMNIEVYSEGDMQSADYESEIWIPVKKKTGR